MLAHTLKLNTTKPEANSKFTLLKRQGRAQGGGGGGGRGGREKWQCVGYQAEGAYEKASTM